MATLATQQDVQALEILQTTTLTMTLLKDGVCVYAARAPSLARLGSKP